MSGWNEKTKGELGTYIVKVQFPLNPDSPPWAKEPRYRDKLYSYLVDGGHVGQLAVGDKVVVATPTGDRVVVVKEVHYVDVRFSHTGLKWITDRVRPSPIEKAQTRLATVKELLAKLEKQITALLNKLNSGLTPEAWATSGTYIISTEMALLLEERKTYQKMVDEAQDTINRLTTPGKQQVPNEVLVNGVVYVRQGWAD